MRALRLLPESMQILHSKMRSQKKNTNIHKKFTLLHSITQPVLIFCRFLGIFPVTGLFSSNEKLRYESKSPYSVFCIISVVIQICLTTACVIHLARGGVTLRNFNKLLVQASGLVCCLNILFLAKKWPRVVTQVNHIEKSLMKSIEKSSVPLYKFVAVVMFCGALLDFALGMNFYLRISHACFNGNSLAESYYIYTMPSAAAILPFSPWSFYPLMTRLMESDDEANDGASLPRRCLFTLYLKEFRSYLSGNIDLGREFHFIIKVIAVVAQYTYVLYLQVKLRKTKRKYIKNIHKYIPRETLSLNRYLFLKIFLIISVQTAFVTQISDMLIIVTGIYLSSHFEDLYDLMIIYKNKYPNMWHIIRVHHASLVRLVRLLDGAISPFVMVSFGNNLSLICIQLYKILKKSSSHAVTDSCDKEEVEKLLDSNDRTVFYISSELLVVARTLASALFAAKVHLSAQKPLQVLYDVPSHCYNTETRRFMDQILSTNVAMSGFHFFYVTRGMIITMTATVITYELVMCQYG